MSPVVRKAGGWVSWVEEDLTVGRGLNVEKFCEILDRIF